MKFQIVDGKIAFGKSTIKTPLFVILKPANFNVNQLKPEL